MSDILSREPDRKPSRWTSPSALAAGGVALVSLVVMLHVFHGSHPRHSTATPPARNLFAAPSPGLTVSAGNSAAGIPAPIEPLRLAGVAAPRGSNLRLLLTGPQPGWFSPATSRFRPISGLPRWRAGYGFTRAAAGWAVQELTAGTPACPNCAGPPTQLYFVANGQASAAKVGLANAASAATGAEALWLTNYQPGADISTTSGIAQEVTLAGHAVGRKITLPRGYAIYRGIGADLLLVQVPQGPALVRYELWDPANGQVVRDFVDVLAASPDQIAWNPCPNSCPINVLSLSSDETATIPLAPGTWAVSGTFSSDRSLLAVQVSAAIRPDGSAAATRLEVFNLASGRATAVPGTLVSSQLGINFGWAPGTDLLLAALEPSPAVLSVASWHPGDKHMSIGTARVPRHTWLVLGDND